MKKTSQTCNHSLMLVYNRQRCLVLFQDQVTIRNNEDGVGLICLW